ncbi:MAG TPA: helix-turn-helix transcriptional regulator [Ktedonobacteraceae bacterium]|nr:helix-turn-helix transcriptional regulator [Ktedonobacteraceae bacterium]
MLNQAEITDQTGIVYLSGSSYGSIGTVPGSQIILHPLSFSQMGTGEDVRPKPGTQLKVSSDLLPYQLLSRTTGSELHDIQDLLLLLTLLVASDRVLTTYHTTFQIKDSMQAKLHAKSVDQTASSDVNVASVQAERLREISGLKVERLAEIFGVSRTTYYKWISGSPLHDIHREHLLEVLPLMEEAAERLGSPNAMNNWLLTPISPGGKKPIDYLAMRQYSIFRGFLLQVRTGREIFRPLPSSSRVHQEISREEAEDTRERLRPRAWRDEDDVDIPTSEEHPNENSR